MPDEYAIRFTCEILEDLHSGSGLGWLDTIDDCQARDAHDEPVVWGTTIKGLLRDVADELLAMQHPSANFDCIQRLLGAEGAKHRSACVVRSLHFSVPPGSEDRINSVTFPSASTAREVHSRRPRDQTLRTIELASAGLKAEGEIRLLGDRTDVAFLKMCLRRLTRIGGNKTRGSGEVKISPGPETKLPACYEVKETPPFTGRLRLLLKNQEPLNIPLTAFPGNILQSESYLPGQMIRGAVLTALAVKSAPVYECNLLAQPAQVQFGNGYYIPASAVGDDLTTGFEVFKAKLQSIQVLPLPLSAEEIKATERSKGPVNVPWWALPSAKDDRWRSLPDYERDRLQEDEPHAAHKGLSTSNLVDPARRFKRIKTEDHLLRDAAGVLWRIRPAMRTIMRNQTPIARLERSQDSRRHDGSALKTSDDKGSLFSEVVLSEDQLFVADIRFDTAEAAKAFWGVAGPWLDEPLEGRAWLRMGRGGRPVIVLAHTWLADDVPAKQNGDSFTLTLTSDWIIRAPDLRFYTKMSPQVLCRAACLDCDPVAQILDATAETRIVHGFNTAAGARRSPAVAIKRGSAFRIWCKDKCLFNALAELEAKGKGVGERQEEGFGRFVLNHPFHTNPAAGDLSKVDRANPATAGQSRETVIEHVIQAVETMHLAQACRSTAFPSRSQWNQFRHEAEIRKDQQEIIEFMNKLRDHSKTLGGRMWAYPNQDNQQKLIEQIDVYRKTLTFRDQRLFLIYLARWVVAHLSESPLREEEAS